MKTEEAPLQQRGQPIVKPMSVPAPGDAAAEAAKELDIAATKQPIPPAPVVEEGSSSVPVFPNPVLY